MLATKHSGPLLVHQDDGWAAEQMLGRSEPHHGSTRGHMKPALTGGAFNPSKNGTTRFG